LRSPGTPTSDPFSPLMGNTLCILPEARPTKVERYQVRNSSLPPRYIAGSQRRRKKEATRIPRDTSLHRPQPK